MTALGKRELRARAEARLVAEATAEACDMSPDEVNALLHELRTHQIELEMQNEELQRAYDELAEARDRFSDLYDSAPVGYVTITAEGVITDANLTAAVMFGMDPGMLSEQPLSAFILPEDQDILYNCRREVLSKNRNQGCELRMRSKKVEPFWAWLEWGLAPAGATDDTLEFLAQYAPPYAFRRMTVILGTVAST